jgi:hypothetical protein
VAELELCTNLVSLTQRFPLTLLLASTLQGLQGSYVFWSPRKLKESVVTSLSWRNMGQLLHVRHMPATSLFVWQLADHTSLVITNF